MFVIRDLVGIVFGAIQECSRQFREAAASAKQQPQLNSANTGDKSNNQQQSASSHAAANYWIERIVYEVSPGRLLAGFWNFPAAALVILFYIYFVNRIQHFNK